MTYGQFLLVFLLPPVLLALWAAGRTLTKAAWVTVAALMAIAFAYTTPWDNYLVIRGVWSFDDARVVGLFLWRVPLEEYLFYLLQILLTGLFTVWLLHRRTTRPLMHEPHPPPQPPSPNPLTPTSSPGPPPWSG